MLKSDLRDDSLTTLIWVVITAANAWAIGRFLAQNDTGGVVFASILGAIAAIVSTFRIVDLYSAWQDERYERAYLASLENFPAVEDE